MKYERPPDGSAFAERLRAIMERQNLNQVDVADLIGVTQASVSRWLRGTVPDRPYALLIAEKLDVEFEWLMYGYGTLPPQGPTLACLQNKMRKSWAGAFERVAIWHEKEFAKRRSTLGAAEVKEWLEGIAGWRQKQKGLLGLADFIVAFMPDTKKQHALLRKNLLPYVVEKMRELNREAEQEIRRRAKSNRK